MKKYQFWDDEYKEFYDGIFLVLDEEGYFDGEITELSETLCVSIRFHGSHAQAPEQYKKLLSYIGEHKLKIGFCVF